jgi:ATP-dependent helicase/DNAse subunit B
MPAPAVLALARAIALQPFRILFARATLVPMRLLTGPAGSGKTSFVLDRFREALRAGDSSVRLLAPTATMARHLQNRIAREGFVFRRELIQTLSGFIETWAGDLRQPSDPTFYLIVEQAVARANRGEFARVAHLPGFCARLAKTIAEFSSAGCGSARLAESLPEAPLAGAFLAVYREVEGELDRRGMALRSRRLALAAAKIEREGLGGIGKIWLDGFHALPDPELRILAALDRHADVTLALADADFTPPVRAVLDVSSQTAFARKRPNPAVTLFHAPTVEREVSEIARRILEQNAAGREFREMGIIVRAADAYVPALRSALGRCGIPARFYFDSNLDRHAAVRFLSHAMNAMLAGWDHAETLAALRLAPRFADSNALDRFDFALREQMPNAGLGAMRALLIGEENQPRSAGAGRVLRKMERLAAIEEWRSFALSPRDWAERLRALRALFRAARPEERPAHEAALEWRSQAAALDLFEEALDEAAEALEARGMPLEEFWRAVESVLRLKPLRLEDGRRNVVPVLSAPEAREWELPIVFVCGLTEKQFPQIHRQDPFFPDDARRKLQRSGVRVRTAADFETDERALFDSALSRATMQVVLSYPDLDRRGESTLPSLYLEDLQLVAEDGAGLAACLGPAQAGGSRQAPPAEVRAPALLTRLGERTARVSPTSLESYLQCPFQYFSSRTLRLRPPPVRPEKRLDFMTQGSIVHDTLKEWYANPLDIGPLFERIFEAALEGKRIPPGYHTERLRNAMLEDLRAFAEDARWPRAAFQSQTEQSFEFPLEGLTVHGKIDRLDTAPDGRAWIIDYKYSAPPGVKQKIHDELLLQAPLYFMAAERAFQTRPAGMFYVGVKSGVTYAGWSAEQVAEIPAVSIPEGWLEDAEARTLHAVEEIRAGRVEVAPASPESCRNCDFGDVCRVSLAAVRAAGEAEAA